jgi:hypothetical protein
VTPASGIATSEAGEEALAADGAVDGAADEEAVDDAASIVAAALADMKAAEDGSADDAAPADPVAVGDPVPELAAAAVAGPPVVGPTTPEAIAPEPVQAEPVQAEPAEAVQPEPVEAASVAATSIDPVLDAPSFFPSVSARTDPSTTPEPQYEATQYGGSNAPRDANAGWGSSAQRPAPDPRYAGPSRPYPDQPAAYSAGTSGRPRRGRLRRVIGLIAAALVIAAAAGVGAAFALRHGGGTSSASANTAPPPAPSKFGSVNAVNNPSTALPSGWTTYTLQPSVTGTTAGFSIDVPPGWTEKRKGLATLFGGPHGMLFEVDLTQHTYRDMAKEAEYIKKQSLANGKFPGYKQFYLQHVPIRGTSGAFWQFTWTPQQDVTQRTDDILFILPTPDGPQSYALYFRAPDSGWNATYVSVFETILRTFQTVPS